MSLRVFTAGVILTLTLGAEAQYRPLPIYLQVDVKDALTSELVVALRRIITTSSRYVLVTAPVGVVAALSVTSEVGRCPDESFVSAVLVPYPTGHFAHAAVVLRKGESQRLAAELWGNLRQTLP